MATAPTRTATAGNKATKSGGALSTAPTSTTDDKTKWKKPPTHKYKGVWVDDKGYRVDGYGRRLPGQDKPFQAIKETKAPGTKPVGIPGAPKGSAEEKFRNLSPEQQNKEVYGSAGALYDQAMAQAMQYDPSKFNYQGQLDQARDVAMKQFHMSMDPEFARQEADFNQRMLEQGIDPNSGSYQAQYRAMKNAQNEALQSAMTNAFTAGAGYEQQGWQQQMQNVMMPGQLWQQFEKPYVTQYATEAEAIQADKNRQAQLQAARIGGGSAVSAAQIAANAQRDAAAMQAMQGYGGQPQVNPWAAAAQGVGTGSGAAATNWALR